MLTSAAIYRNACACSTRLDHSVDQGLAALLNDRRAEA
jgi:hypothetical protein